MASTNQNKPSFWNRELSKPVTCSLAIFPTWSECEVLQGARQALSNCVHQLSQQEHLEAEFFVLNRLVYMKQGQLRREKSFQGLKQLRTCMKKFFALGLEKRVKEIHCHFEEAVVQEGIRVYLPSRQMWEYLLTTVLGAAALLTNIVSRCSSIFLHVHRHLTAGMLITTNVMFLSLLGRIWACCQALSLELQKWYRLLKPAVDVLKSTQVAWLPEGEVLPDDLSVWLEEQGFSSGLKREGSGDDSLASLVAKYQLKGQEDATDGSAGPPLINSALPVTVEEDFGEAVDIREVTMRNGDQGGIVREDTAESVPVRGKVSLKEKVMTATTIQDLQGILRKFQKKRPEFRTNSKLLKCVKFLANLQTKSRDFERKGESGRLPALLAKCRKKVIRSIAFLSKSKSGTLPVSQGERPLAKNQKKKNKGKQNAAQKGQPDAASKNKGKRSAAVKGQPDMAAVNGEQNSFLSKRTIRNPCVKNNAKNRQKQKTSKKSASEKGKKKTKLHPKSAGRKDTLECRRIKKNDPVNNQGKATQVKQKKRKARNV